MESSYKKMKLELIIDSTDPISHIIEDNGYSLEDFLADTISNDLLNHGLEVEVTNVVDESDNDIVYVADNGFDTAIGYDPSLLMNLLKKGEE